MENKKLIAEALLEIAKKSITEIIEVDSDFDLIEAATHPEHLLNKDDEVKK